MAKLRFGHWMGVRVCMRVPHSKSNTIFENSPTKIACWSKAKCQKIEWNMFYARAARTNGKGRKGENMNWLMLFDVNVDILVQKNARRTDGKREKKWLGVLCGCWEWINIDINDNNKSWKKNCSSIERLTNEPIHFVAVTKNEMSYAIDYLYLCVSLSLSRFFSWSALIYSIKR